MPLTQYIDECFKQILNKDTIINKRSILRIDISHLIKFVSGWRCFKQNSHKEFYVRCVDKMLRTTTLEDFETVITNVLNVAFSKYTDSLSNIYQVSYDFLLNLMKTDEQIPRSSDPAIFADYF